MGRDTSHAVEGDSRSADIDAVIARWSDAVWRLCLCRLHEPRDAEDAFQNTFLALCDADVAFRSAEHEKAWLLRCAINCCNQIMRATALRARKAQEYMDMQRARGPRVEAMEPGSGPGSDVDPELEAALALLTDKQRTTVHLHYFEGYSTDEVASLTGEKPATVRSHLHRARKAMRIGLEKGRLDTEKEAASCAKAISDAGTTPCSEA